MHNAAVGRGGFGSPCRINLFERGNDKRHGLEDLGPRGNLFSRRVAKSRFLETPQRLEQDIRITFLGPKNKRRSVI